MSYDPSACPGRNDTVRQHWPRKEGAHYDKTCAVCKTCGQRIVRTQMVAQNSWGGWHADQYIIEETP